MPSTRRRTAFGCEPTARISAVNLHTFFLQPPHLPRRLKKNVAASALCGRSAPHPGVTLSKRVRERVEVARRMPRGARRDRRGMCASRCRDPASPRRAAMQGAAAIGGKSEDRTLALSKRSASKGKRTAEGTRLRQATARCSRARSGGLPCHSITTANTGSGFRACETRAPCAPPVRRSVRAKPGPRRAGSVRGPERPQPLPARPTRPPPRGAKGARGGKSSKRRRRTRRAAGRGRPAQREGHGEEEAPCRRPRQKSRRAVAPRGFPPLVRSAKERGDQPKRVPERRPSVAPPGAKEGQGGFQRGKTEAGKPRSPPPPAALDHRARRSGARVLHETPATHRKVFITKRDLTPGAHAPPAALDHHARRSGARVLHETPATHTKVFVTKRDLTPCAFNDPTRFQRCLLESETPGA